MEFFFRLVRVPGSGTQYSLLRYDARIGGVMTVDGLMMELAYFRNHHGGSAEVDFLVTNHVDVIGEVRDDSYGFDKIHEGYANEPYGGEKGCGLFFCGDHRYVSSHDDDPEMCERCCDSKEPFKPKPDHPDWIKHKLTDPSWQQWRDDNPE